MKRTASHFALLLFGLLLGLLLLEGGARVAGLWLEASRPELADDGDYFVVLCLGDSHTWAGSKGYPARLSARLAERSDRFRVINLGVPGTNTAQLKERLPRYLDIYDPDVVVFWAGVNNSWNRAGRSEADGADDAGESLWQTLLDSSRIVRFFRVREHEAKLRRLLDESDAYVASPAMRRPGDARGTRRRTLFGEEDTFVSVGHGTSYEEDRVLEWTESDFRWLFGRVREHGIPVLAIEYPANIGIFVVANRGIQKAGTEMGTPVIRGSDAFERLTERFPGKEKMGTFAFDKSAHPRQPLYDEIGDLVLETLDEHGYLPAH